MSKATIKKLLRSMSKEQIIEMVIEMYDARKEAKDYLEYYASPDENSKLEEYKDIIREEFYPEGRREPKTRFSVCRKAVADFKKLKPSADALAELMLSYMEYAIEFTYDYGDMWEQYYDSVEGNFDKTVQFIAKTVCGKSMTSDFSSVSSGRAFVAMVLPMVSMTYTRRQGRDMDTTKHNLFL